MMANQNYFDIGWLVPDVSFFTAVLLFCFLLFLVYLNTRRDPRFPPGPRLYPIIGNLPALFGKDTLKMLNRLRKQHGDVFGLYIGTELTIFLNGYDVIHDALIKQGRLFSQRPISKFHKISLKYPGIFFNNGLALKEQRTFSIISIRDICFKNGGRELEEIIYQELECMYSVLEKATGLVYIDDYICSSVGNVIFMVLFRHRFEFKDDFFESVLSYFRTAANDFSRMTVLGNCFPYFYYLPYDMFGIQSVSRKYDQIRCLFEQHIIESSSNDRCVHEDYLRKIESNKTRPCSSFTPKQMTSTFLELIGASIDTSSTTIHWAILHLARNQGVQENMYREIKTVIGTDQKPTIKDKTRLPYTEAVILEVMRISAVAPLAIPHTVSHDTMFNGYLFPENCTIIINLESCLKDPDVWKDPEEFRPERFLNHDGTKVEIPDEFIPFSAGPRRCLGETIAKLQIFLFVAALSQRYKFLPEEEDEFPEVKGKLGLVWHPLRFAVNIARR